MKVVGYYKKTQKGNQELIARSFLGYFDGIKDNRINILTIKSKFKIIDDVDLCLIVSWRSISRRIGIKYKDKGVPIIVAYSPAIRKPDYRELSDEYFALFWDGPYHTYYYDDLPSNRWKKLRKRFKIKVRPWRTQINGHIVITYQTAPSFSGRNRDNFYERSIRLSLETGHKVLICVRPTVGNQKGIKKKLLKKWKSWGCKISSGIDGNLDNAYCLISAGGTTLSKAVLYGIPAYCPEESIISPLMNNDELSQFLKDPPTPDRTRWLRWAAYQQWTPQEMKWGLPFKYITVSIPSITGILISMIIRSGLNSFISTIATSPL